MTNVQCPMRPALAPGRSQSSRWRRSEVGRKSRAGAARHRALDIGHWSFRASRAGFTLVEVLIALAVFAMAAVVLGSAYLNILNSYTAASRGARLNEDFAFARQLVITEPDRTKLEDGGEFDNADGRRVKWSVDITSSNEADVYNVAFTCEVDDPSTPEPQKLVQNFMLLRPTWVIDQAEHDKLKADAKQRILDIQGKKQP
jgi:general secretion pathway protein I